jgi:DNA polymerase eta
VLHVRDDALASRSRQTAFPFTSRFTVDYIMNYAQRLLKEMVPESTAQKGLLGVVTNLGLSFTTLESTEEGQKGIENFFGVVPAKRKPGEGGEEQGPDSDDDKKRHKEEEGRWYTCEKCGKRLPVEGETEQVRMEHEDWHFAR